MSDGGTRPDKIVDVESLDHAMSRDRPGRVHVVAILAMHRLVVSDLAGPYDLLSRVVLGDGQPGYAVKVCGVAREVRGAAFSIKAPGTLADLAGADTIILPGVEVPSAPVLPSVISALRSAARRGTRIASVCTGAFVLAATGLLDGRRATTHWLAAQALATAHPAIAVDANVLYVDEGQFITSAGASAGLDMCLHLIRRDHGQAVAAHSARLAVAPLDREGGQAQFIAREPPGSGSDLAPILSWMDENAARPLTLRVMARRAGMSTRTFSRRFRAQTGLTPLQWLLTARSRRAMALLESTDLPIEDVAARSGFEGISTFRERFHRDVGVTPSRYRQTFKGTRRYAEPDLQP